MKTCSFLSHYKGTEQDQLRSSFIPYVRNTAGRSLHKFDSQPYIICIVVYVCHMTLSIILHYVHKDIVFFRIYYIYTYILILCKTRVYMYVKFTNVHTHVKFIYRFIYMLFVVYGDIYSHIKEDLYVCNYICIDKFQCVSLVLFLGPQLFTVRRRISSMGITISSFQAFSDFEITRHMGRFVD